MHLRAFALADEAAVVARWKRCGLTRPWNDPHKDIQRKLTTQPELFFVGEEDDRIVATAMAGYDGHRGWVNYLAVDPESRGRGHGRLLLRHIEEQLRARGCPKLNLQVRTGNNEAIEFYRRLGYGVDENITMGKRLIPDAGDQRD
jgi:ribosomal protein S18 acetylase RimI-like enzyme